MVLNFDGNMTINTIILNNAISCIVNIVGFVVNYINLVSLIILKYYTKQIIK